MDHPLRAMLRIMYVALAVLLPDFEGLCAKFGRPSIPAERPLRALRLQAFYSGSLGAAADGTAPIQSAVSPGLSGCCWMTIF